MFEKYKPNYVIHLAACVGGLYKNMNNKVKMLEDNLMINYNVIKCAHDYNVEKLISCLSTCIFPDKVSYPIVESMLHEGPPHFSNDSYAYAKRMLEIHTKAYRENYGDKFMCIIPTNIYGPHDNFHLEDAHVIPMLIHKCYLSKQNNINFIIRGTGKPLRQFIYSEDLAKMILTILFKSNNLDNIILSVPESQEISIENYQANLQISQHTFFLQIVCRYLIDHRTNTGKNALKFKCFFGYCSGESPTNCAVVKILSQQFSYREFPTVITFIRINDKIFFF